MAANWIPGAPRSSCTNQRRAHAFGSPARNFLVIASDWDDKHPGNPPQLMGQLFHRFESPNRFGLPAFYTLHVWAWKDSPTGTFVNWNSIVSCDGFKGQ